MSYYNRYEQALTRLTENFTLQNYITFLDKFGTLTPCCQSHISEYIVFPCNICPLRMRTSNPDELLLCLGHDLEEQLSLLKEPRPSKHKVFYNHQGVILLSLIKFLQQLRNGPTSRHKSD